MGTNDSILQKKGCSILHNPKIKKTVFFTEIKNLIGEVTDE
jgi:hypothetical protein